MCNVAQTKTPIKMEFNQEELQKYFDANINDVIDADEDEMEYIEQCHSGDMLIEKYDHDSERFKLWKTLDCNGGGILIEYAGRLNRHSWETVYEL
tara:strand:+ start:175 stop:459 length:285 start_codon:yes stop_codon:yes gene_type:complete